MPLTTTDSRTCRSPIGARRGLRGPVQDHALRKRSSSHAEAVHGCGPIGHAEGDAEQKLELLGNVEELADDRGVEPERGLRNAVESTGRQREQEVRRVHADVAGDTHPVAERRHEEEGDMGSAEEVQVLAGRCLPACLVRARYPQSLVEGRGMVVRPVAVGALAEVGVGEGEIVGEPLLLIGPEQFLAQGVSWRTRDDMYPPRLGVAVRGGGLSVFQHATDVGRGQRRGQELPNGAPGPHGVGQGRCCVGQRDSSQCARSRRPGCVSRHGVFQGSGSMPQAAAWRD